MRTFMEELTFYRPAARETPCRDRCKKRRVEQPGELAYSMRWRSLFTEDRTGHTEQRM
jgi:hypothetical protein